MQVSRRLDHTAALFWKRTVSAQIHALGFFLLIAEAFFLLAAENSAGAGHVWGCLLYLVTGAFVFAFSSTYHFMHDGFQISSKLEALLERLDHFGIYLFIAGTYTPVLLNTVSPRGRVPLLGAIWTIALLGIGYTEFKNKLPKVLQHRFVYTLLFILMGFFFLIRAPEMFNHLAVSQITLLVGGVVAYCLGALVYSLQRPNPAKRFGYHEIWHLSVLLGAQLHFFLVLSFYR